MCLSDFKIFVHSVSWVRIYHLIWERSVEHWRRLALLRSGEVEPCPCLPRAVFWKQKKEFSGADVTAGTVKLYRRAVCRFQLFSLW